MAGQLTKPLEKNTPLVAKEDSKAELKMLEQQIAAIKNNTPHYDVPMVSGVAEAALFVNPR